MMHSHQRHLFVCLTFLVMLGGSLAEQADAAVVPYSGSDIIATNGPNSGSDPVPYGQVNNLSDGGWIWGNTNFFTVDFGVPQAITSIRPYSVYTGGERGAMWKIEHSDDNVSWSMDDGEEFDFRTCSNSTDDCGLNDLGDPEVAGMGYGGWYEYSFNFAGPNAHRYWKLSQTQVTVSHAPRTGEIQFLAGDFTASNLFQWKADGVGQWSSTRGSWSPSGVPSTGDQTVVFGSHANISGPITVAVNSAVKIGRIEFNNANFPYAVAGNGSLDLVADSVGGSPSVDVQAGSHEFQVRTNLQADTYLNVETGQSLQFNHRLNLNGNTLTKTGDGSLAINNNLTTGTGGSLNCEGGNCSGSGTVNGALVNGSTVSPGNSPGVLTVDGDYTQGGTATLAIELTGNGGVAGTDYDRLLVWGTANLSGVLDLQVDAGYTPTIGDSMPGIVTSANVSGTFNTTNNVVFNGRQGLAVTYTETSVDAQVALRGNTDVASGDVDVDTGDLTTSIINFTSAGGSGKTWADGDMDGDGDVDTGDLTTSIINFTSALSGGTNTVPEPGSLLLLVMGMMALAVANRKTAN